MICNGLVDRILFFDVCRLFRTRRPSPPQRTFTFAVRGRTVYLTNERGEADELATLNPTPISFLWFGAWLDGRKVEPLDWREWASGRPL